MNKIVLFSLLGMTDPTRDNYDGPFLHILRHYQPAKTYLFMTQEICVYDNVDNRYEILAKRLARDCEIIKLRHEEIDNPHEFGLLDDLFKQILRIIREENPGYEIIMNLSSGTTQMLSALYMLCAVGKRPVTGIQVLTLLLFIFIELTPRKGTETKNSKLQIILHCTH